MIRARQDASLEPPLPFEFVVYGTSISMQGSSRSKDAWKDRIREAALDALPAGAWLLMQPLAVTIFIFPSISMQGDLDNRIKPILDAMNLCVYRDDGFIHALTVRKFEPGHPFSFANPTMALRTALEADEPIVYIRIDDGLMERSV